MKIDDGQIELLRDSVIGMNGISIDATRKEQPKLGRTVSTQNAHVAVQSLYLAVGAVLVVMSA